MSLLSDLKNLLSSEQEASEPKPRNPNFITQPSRIKHALQQLMEAHVHLAIILDDQSEHTSRLIGVTTNGLLLDQLNSRLAHNKMLPSSHIHIEAKHNAIPFNFTSSIQKPAQNGGYLITLPEKIYHPQKRAFFRIPLDYIEKHKFTAALKYSENTLSGYLFDISHGGLCVAINSNSYVKKGDILSPASLLLKGGQAISVDLTVCSVKKTPQDGLTRLGCEFLNIEPAEKRALHKFIAECARERAKK